MAVTKLWKVSVRLGQVLDYTTNPEKTANPEYSAEDYQALKDVLAYAKDEEKTEHEFSVTGSTAMWRWLVTSSLPSRNSSARRTGFRRITGI